ncbi:hypothetical protein G2W53_021763 [Senna tora]|uniref:DUF4283 domain-containing protein n=1 Tax=Senna tora TaxID=362788 RepID=A0A834TTD7_9FABA|nr:hypothetical protein G2W53_021763 [Senna tora]
MDIQEEIDQECFSSLMKEKDKGLINFNAIVKRIKAKAVGCKIYNIEQDIGYGDHALIVDSDASEDDDEDVPFDPCPKLRFSQEELDEWCHPWKLTLIVHLMGRIVGVTFMKNMLEKLWKRDGDDDFVHAYHGAPWMVADHFLVVQRWKPSFNPKDVNEVTRIAASVQTPSLTLEFYNVRFAHGVLSLWMVWAYEGSMSLEKGD